MLPGVLLLLLEEGEVEGEEGERRHREPEKEKWTPSGPMTLARPGQPSPAQPCQHKEKGKRKLEYLAATSSPNSHPIITNTSPEECLETHFI